MRALKLTLLIATVAVAAIAPPAHARVERQAFQINGLYPDRIGAVLSFVPVAGMPEGTKEFRVRAGGITFLGRWANFLVSRHDTTEMLKFALRGSRGRYGQLDEVYYTDRPLTATEKKSFVERIDLLRDADVLVVTAGHPACAGLTRAQARSVARGETTRWSQVTQSPGGEADTIAVRFAGRRGYEEPRLGATKYPSSARGTTDGGLREAFDGNRAVAGVTSWSRVRRFTSRVCTVPLDGIAPTDASVRALSYPESYPIRAVTLRKRQYIALNRVLRTRYLAFLQSERAKQLFRDRGALVVGDTPAD